VLAPGARRLGQVGEREPGCALLPRSWASLIARASPAYPAGPSPTITRCSPGGSADPFGGRSAPRVSSAPKTVGKPSARAATANRTTP